MTRSIQTNTPTVRGNRAPSVSVVIPTLNEERNLPFVFSRLPREVAEVVLVDGGSVDRTVAVAKGLWPSLVTVDQTRTGKGNALACGFQACTSDIVVMIDADGSTDPGEIPRFVATLIGGADFAKGSRFAQGGGSADITTLRRWGNSGLNRVVNSLFGTRFTDLCYGYNAFWRELVPALELPDPALPAGPDGSKLWGDGFEVETLINIRVAASGFRVHEVASFEALRHFGESKLNTFRDGRRVLSTVLREFRRRRGEATAEITRPSDTRQPADILTLPAPEYPGRRASWPKNPPREPRDDRDRAAPERVLRAVPDLPAAHREG